MNRWSLKNIFRSVTHSQFADYTRQFKQAAETSFGAECSLQICALTQPKAYTTFWDDDIQSSLDEINERNTILRTENLSDLTPEVWSKSGYVEVIVSPIDRQQAPDSAFGHAEFKGGLPRQATFYIQPDGQNVREAMVSSAKGKLVGSGFDSNGSRSWAVPAGLARLGSRSGLRF